MCAVIGSILANPTTMDLAKLERVMLESKIRGLHATGISYIKDNKLVTVKKPVPADEFDFKWKDYINEDGNLYFIGHCRYSTSDLEFNQPIDNGNISVSHNGVITQELPEKWKELYGYDCETKNDSELLVHTIEADVSPLERWKDSSLAVCVLRRDTKTLQVFRNGKRPLYLTAVGNGSIITSTKDVIFRSGIDAPTVDIPMNTYVTFDNELTMTVERVDIKDAVDLQKDSDDVQ